MVQNINYKQLEKRNKLFLQKRIFGLISKERKKQDIKFGEQNHEALQWFSIIG